MLVVVNVSVSLSATMCDECRDVLVAVCGSVVSVGYDPSWFKPHTDSESRIQCGISGCRASFPSTASFDAHYNRCRRCSSCRRTPRSFVVTSACFCDCSSHRNVCRYCRQVLPTSRLLDMHIRWHLSFM
jgi:hypothetical protein